MADARVKWVWTAKFSDGNRGVEIGGDSTVPASYDKGRLKQSVEADAREKHREVRGMFLIDFEARKN